MMDYLVGYDQSGQTRSGNRAPPLSWMSLGRGPAWLGLCAGARLATGSAAAGLAASDLVAADRVDVAGLALAVGWAAAAGLVVAAAGLAGADGLAAAGLAGVGVAASCCVALAWRTLAESLSFRFVMIRSPRD